MLHDEEIARLTVPEILVLIKRLLDEIELRCMEVSE
jgi:hypothetical protein